MQLDRRDEFSAQLSGGRTCVIAALGLRPLGRALEQVQEVLLADLARLHDLACSFDKTIGLMQHESAEPSVFPHDHFPCLKVRLGGGVGRVSVSD